MPAEPFIFLSSDRLVDVRCCKVGNHRYFCVKDFIRRTANRRMGPLDALQYWMSISLTLQHEKDIMHAYVFKFPGPYEKPSVCIKANGLMLLLHHMEAKHRLVSQTYRQEVFDRLKEVVEGDGEKYIEDYDDGEVDKQIAEEGMKGLTQPPNDSPFWYVPFVKVDGAEVPIDVALKLQKEQTKILEEKLVHQEDELAVMKQDKGRMSHVLNARIAELEEEVERKRKRDGAFSLKVMIQNLGLDIPEDQIRALCRRVVTQCKKDNPKIELSKRQRVVYFAPDHKDEVEHILQQECLKLQLKQAEKDHWVNMESGLEGKQHWVPVEGGKSTVVK